MVRATRRGARAEPLLHHRLGPRAVVGRGGPQRWGDLPAEPLRIAEGERELPHVVLLLGHGHAGGLEAGFPVRQVGGAGSLQRVVARRVVRPVGAWVEGALLDGEVGDVALPREGVEDVDVRAVQAGAGHVQGDEHARRQVGRQVGDQRAQRLDPSGRRSDDDQVGA